MTGIAWNGSLFVAVGGAAIQTSPDGITWTVRTNPLSGASFKSVDAVDTSFVATTTIGSGQGALASADGITWLQIRDPAFAGFSSSIAMSVAWSGVMAIAVGQATPSGTVFARSLRRLSL